MKDSRQNNRKLGTIAFFIIFILGIILRIWKLNNLPNGLDGDVIVSASNSLHIFNDTEFKIFQNNPIMGKQVAYLFWSMPLGSFLIGIFMNVFKQVEYGVLFSSVLVGILGIPLVYLFTKKISDISTALLATFFFAVSPIHTVFSRSGFTHISIVVTLVTLSIYLLYKIVETQNKKIFYLCGLVWGIILFNSYPIAFIVAPITVIYFIWIGKLKWLFSKEFIIGVLFSLILYLFLSIGFAFINKSSDLLIVIKDGYYQWIGVRLSETTKGTTYLKNIFDGIQILFGKIKPSYQFGVLRIMNYPVLDQIVGFSFIIGLLISIIRRNIADKLLIVWTVITFISTSVFNIPQERYLFVLLPVPYIYCSAILIAIIRYGLNYKLKSIRLYTSILLTIFLFSYVYFIEYQEYFVSYANNNANLTHGLADGEVADYLNKTINADKTQIISSINLAGVNLISNYKYKHWITWSEFLNKVSEESIDYDIYGISLPEYPSSSINTVNDGNIDTYWLGRIPTSLILTMNGNQKINIINSFLCSVGPGRESIKYSLEYQKYGSDKWNPIKSGINKDGLCNLSIRNLNIDANKLRLNFLKTKANDSLQSIEEIYIMDYLMKTKLFSPEISDIILILAFNPNFKKYDGNYYWKAQSMEKQANIIFGDISKKLVKTIKGNNNETIFDIYLLKADDIQI